MIQFSDREIVNEQLVLDSKTEVYYLGHDLTLRHCSIIVKVPARALIIARSKLIDCTIDVKKELKGFRWETNLLQGCRFTGRFFGNDFGPRPDSLHPGFIEDCDFSAAHLDGCRFLGCDASTLRFPRWPCFTILDPVRRYRELRAAPWPGDIGRIKVEGFAMAPPTTVAVTYSAPELAKRFSTTPEAIRATLEKLDGVLY
ncbi:MAG: hypothetical protein JXB05_27630 [Myxococcaceae bacterium]|nr:hypothetical protein [Myxococcaceae bacterium]